MFDRNPDAKEEDFYVEHRCFRANILVDTPEPYEEDEFIEMRVGSLLLRSAGPCIRCKAVEVNSAKAVLNPE